MTILPPSPPQRWLTRLAHYRSISNVYVYIHIDREQLTHEARMPRKPRLLLSLEAIGARQPRKAVLTRGNLTCESRGARDE
jgi:hypothetical protein